MILPMFYDEDIYIFRTINVVKPASIPPGQKLPVVAVSTQTLSSLRIGLIAFKWIFGGGFESGSTSMHDGGVIVETSIDMDQPVIYVSMNYRQV